MASVVPLGFSWRDQRRDAPARLVKHYKQIAGLTRLPKCNTDFKTGWGRLHPGTTNILSRPYRSSES